MDPVRLPCSYRKTPVIPTDPTELTADLPNIEFAIKSEIAEDVPQPTQLLVPNTAYKPQLHGVDDATFLDEDQLRSLGQPVGDTEQVSHMPAHIGANIEQPFNPADIAMQAPSTPTDARPIDERIATYSASSSYASDGLQHCTTSPSTSYSKVVSEFDYSNRSSTRPGATRGELRTITR